MKTGLLDNWIYSRTGIYKQCKSRHPITVVIALEYFNLYTLNSRRKYDSLINSRRYSSRRDASARAGHNSGHGWIPQAVIMDMGSATKSDDIFVVFDKTSWFGRFLAVLLLFFFSLVVSRGGSVSFCTDQNPLNWSKHAHLVKTWSMCHIRFERIFGTSWKLRRSAVADTSLHGFWLVVPGKHCRTSFRSRVSSSASCCRTRTSPCFQSAFWVVPSETLPT